MDQETAEKLKLMLGVEITKIEEEGDQIIVYIPKSQIARAIGSGGSVVRAAELVVKRKILVKESQ
ncbi:MAG: KH domain-containing protein [Candidatus Hadarchaeales archaeon]